MDLWQQLRGSGFVNGAMMSADLDTHAKYVVSLMAKLPYVKPVYMTNEYSHIDENSIGIRLAPIDRQQKLPIVDEVAIAEPV